MPFGKYKGRKMEDVPADYFHYLWTHGLDRDFSSPVHRYIRENMDALMKDHPDGIWE
ncbi:MAG: DUF3820 family protein [Bacteroidetes bacterium]|nr:DUF3820 family protein [Bacteroidota bacterium]